MALVPVVEEQQTERPIEGEFVQEPTPEPVAPPKEDAPLSIEFIATLAGVNTAAKPLNFDIDGGAKISLETDESQTPYVIGLLALKRARLIVNVRVDMSTSAQPATGKVKRSRKKKPAAEPEAD